MINDVVLHVYNKSLLFSTFTYSKRVTQYASYQQYFSFFFYDIEAPDTDQDA